MVDVEQNQSTPLDAETPSYDEFGRPVREQSVTTWELSRYAAGELSAERRSEIEALSQTDARVADALTELEAERSAFAAQMPFARFDADHQARQSRSFFARAKSGVAAWLNGGSLLPAAGALGACALLLVVVANTQTPSSVTRTKGGAQIAFFVKDGENARLGRDGETLFSGDRIQFAVRDDAKAKSMVIVGIDGTGAVTIYAQDDVAREKGASVATEPRVLPRSVILDDALGTERFFVLYGDQSAAELSAEAKKAATELVQQGVSLSSLSSLPVAVRAQNSVHIVKGRR